MWTGCFAGHALQSPHHVLPVYITAAHWQRVLDEKLLDPVLQLLCPEHKSGTGRSAPADAWLQAMPKLMNTAVVLLMDKVSRTDVSMHASQRPGDARLCASTSQMHSGVGCILLSQM